jgi:hypothetical protein
MSENNPPVIHVLPARAGMEWLKQSWSLILAQPARLLFLAVLLQLVLGLTSLPLVGLFIILAMPALTAGLLQAFNLIAGGQQPGSLTLFSPLASNPRSGRLFALGLVLMLVGILSVSLILSGTESSLDAELMARIEAGDLEAVTQLDPELISKMILAIVVGISVSGTLSFMAIPLIWFHDQKLVVSLISGMKALVLNWQPFLVLTLGLAAVLVPVFVVLSILFQLSGVSGVLSILLLGLIMLIALLFQLIIFGTQYCSFRDIYGLDSVATSLPESDSDDHQLVA